MLPRNRETGLCVCCLGREGSDSGRLSRCEGSPVPFRSSAGDGAQVSLRVRRVGWRDTPLHVSPQGGTVLGRDEPASSPSRPRGPCASLRLPAACRVCLTGRERARVQASHIITQPPLSHPPINDAGRGRRGVPGPPSSARPPALQISAPREIPAGQLHQRGKPGQADGGRAPSAQGHCPWEDRSTLLRVASSLCAEGGTLLLTLPSKPYPTRVPKVS